tara:strand:+ start:62 stop:223 length:162 start_codon:yes stop_codon:yes gene_type:complete
MDLFTLELKVIGLIWLGILILCIIEGYYCAEWNWEEEKENKKVKKKHEHKSTS